MSHLVFARKYRPQTFAELVGQEAIVKTLQNAIKQNRLAHAFLFTGPQGVGKTSTARILAKALNCQEGPAPEPCNRCSCCEGITGGQEIDVIEIDGASNRGLDEARAIRDNVKYRPARSRFKIYLIDEVHMLTPQAFNALLKTIEEPPPHVKFITATTHPQNLPLTFHSRCQRFDFRRVSSGLLAERLKKIGLAENLSLPDEVYRLAAEQGQGSIRDAETLLEKLVAFGGGKVTLEEAREIIGGISLEYLEGFLTAVHQADAPVIFLMLEKFYSSGREPMEFIRELVSYAGDLLRLHTASASERNRLATEIPLFENKLSWADRFSLPSLLFLADTLLSLEERLRHSPHPRLQLELSCLKLTQLHDLASLPDILRKLEQAELRSSSSADGVPASPPSHRKAGNSPSSAIASHPAPTLPPPHTSPAPPLSPSLSPSPTLPPFSSLSPSPPASPSPASDPAALLSSLKERWPALVEELKKRRMSLGSMLMEGELMEVEDSRLTVAFAPPYKFHRDQLSAPDKKGFVEELLREVWGNSYTLVFTLKGSDSPPASPSDPSSSSRKPEEEPLVRKALQLFNGKIVNREQKE